MMSFWIFLLFVLGKVSQSLAADHCSQACESCNSKVQVCVVIPQSSQFPCLCKLHSAMCEGFADNVVFHKGKCLRNTSSFVTNGAVPLFTFVDSSPVNLRSNGNSFYSPIELTPRERTILKLLEGSSTTPGHLPTHSEMSEPLNSETPKKVGKEVIKHQRVRSVRREDEEDRAKKMMCQLFYESDRNFGNHNKDKHFQCKTADPTKIEIL